MCPVLPLCADIYAVEGFQVQVQIFSNYILNAENVCKTGKTDFNFKEGQHLVQKFLYHKCLKISTPAPSCKPWLWEPFQEPPYTEVVL